MPDQRIRKRDQLTDAILGLRYAQSVADDALIAHHADAEGLAFSCHLEYLEAAVDRMERRIAAFRLELQAQQSTLPAYAPSPVVNVDPDDIPFSF